MCCGFCFSSTEKGQGRKKKEGKGEKKGQSWTKKKEEGGLVGGKLVSKNPKIFEIQESFNHYLGIFEVKRNGKLEDRKKLFFNFFFILLSFVKYFFFFFFFFFLQGQQKSKTKKKKRKIKEDQEEEKTNQAPIHQQSEQPFE